MAENRASGPQLGQMVIFTQTQTQTQTQTIFYPAIIVSIERVQMARRLLPSASRAQIDMAT